MSLILHQVGMILVRLRTEEAKEVIEALSGWPMIERAGVGRFFVRRYAILANRKGVVSVVAQDLGDRTGRGRHAAVPSGEAGGHHRVRKSGLVHGCAVTPSQERGAGGSADCRRMEVRIAQTIGGKAVESRSLDKPTECAGSAIAYIIDQNPHHVRGAGRRFHGLRPPFS